MFDGRSIVCLVVVTVGMLHTIGETATAASRAFRGCGASADNLAERAFSERFCQEPIDVVYTWVNGSDPSWLREMQSYRHQLDGPQLIARQRCTLPNSTTADNATACSASDEDFDVEDQASSNRFRDNEELRYSMRSLFKYAPWVRKVYVVTNGQVPRWLDVEHPRVEVVTHEQIFADPTVLPVFSSPAIEVALHRVPGLSDKFLYFNDDVMLGANTWPEDFYTHSGGQKVYYSWPAPNCNPGCIEAWIGDGYCDKACNTSRCSWDDGDCSGPSIKPGAGLHAGSHSRSSIKPRLRTFYCSEGCPSTWLGDKTCDIKCDTPLCGYDAGDCSSGVLRSSLPVAVPRDTSEKVTFEQSSSEVVSRAVAVAEGTDGLDRLVAEQLALARLRAWNESFTECRQAIPGTVDASMGAKLQRGCVARAERAAADLGITNTNPIVLRLALSPIDLGMNETSGYVDLRGLSSSLRRVHSMVSRGCVAEGGRVWPGVHNNTACGDDAAVRVQWTEALLSDDSEPWLPGAVLVNHAEAMVLVGDLLVQHGTEEVQFADKLSKLPAASTVQEASMGVLAGKDGMPTPLMQLQRLARGGAQPRESLDIDECIVPAVLDDSDLGGFYAKWVQLCDEAVPVGLSVPCAETELVLSAQVGSVSVRVDTRASFRRTVSTPPPPPPAANTTEAANGTQRGERHLVIRGRPGKAGRSVRVADMHSDTIVLQLHPSASPKGPGRHLMQEPPAEVGWEDALLDSIYRSVRTERVSTAQLVRDAWRRAVEMSSLPHTSGRVLLDTYGDSLVFSNRLVSREFGRKTRKVPAHMPHLIDRAKMQQVQEHPRFADEWKATNVRRFRDPQDLQYAFVYFYWVIDGLSGLDSAVEEFWRKEIDVDGDGVLNPNEFYTLAVVVRGRTPDEVSLNMLQECLRNATAKVQGDIPVRGITLEVVRNCAFALEAVEDRAKRLYLVRAEEGPADQVAFEMIGDDFNKTRQQLDSIRARRAKFICINDDMRKASAPLRQLLRDFFLSYYPSPCPFELEPGQEHSIPTIDAVRWKIVVRQWSRVVGSLIVIGMLSWVVSAWFKARLGSEKRAEE
jgi:hypothetical protein